MACPACRSTGVIYDPETGEVCCGSCGMVIDRAEDPRDGFDNNLHATILPGAGSTIVGHPDTGPSRLRKSDARCRVRNVPGKIPADRVMRLRSVHDRLGLPAPARLHAEALYAELVRSGFAVGRSTNGVMAAAAYVACRELSIPRTLRDAAAAGGTRPRTFGRYVRQIIDTRGAVPQYDLPHLVALVANNLGVNGSCRRDAIEAARGIEPTYAAGKSPMVIAAAILYVALAARNEPYSQQDVAGAADVCAASVRARSREIRKMAGGR